MTRTDERAEVFRELAHEARERAAQDFLCFGQVVVDFGPIMQDVIHDRIAMGGWPTRDRAVPEEVC